MAYRVQNHLLDILVPGQENAGKALLIDVDSNATPTCTYVPRQLSRDELVKLLPEKWITNYEQIHQAPVRSTSAPEFVRHENGLVEIKFSSSQSKSDNVFPTGIHRITPTDQEPAQEIKHIYPCEHTTHAREEFLKMKCCSFQKKDLEKHDDCMSQRFYCLNRVDDVNLKQVFLNSFPKSLGNKAYRALEAKNVTIAETNLGELYQLILNALAKLCNQKKFLAEFERTRKRLGIACDDKYLRIKCKDKSSCDCTHTKKKFHSKRFSGLSGKPQFSRQSNKKWKFIRMKKQHGKTSDRCFVCQKRGHFARNCPDKKRSQALIQALNQVEPVDVSDLESLYSLDDEPIDSVLCTIAYSELLSDNDSDIDSLEGDSDFGVYMINPIPHVLPIQEDPPLPLAKIYLLTDAYAKPILVIAFIFTGSSVSILNPNILPDHYWKPHHQNFMAANGEKFVIDKISIAINIRLFPKCVIKRRLLGSSSHGKDLLIGFDILHKLPNLRWSTDDKFPLPQKKSLFQHLADAKVLSKFDLKSGFWQLGIKPEDRPKTAFCIPDHHYQWKSHAELLSKFYSLVTKYQPQPQVAQELLKFPDELSSQKMIQQFLGLVNYMADFLPKLSHHTVWLFPMLKKNPLQWTSEAVKAIKSLAEQMPPLKIPASSEKRILQTDASDECWGAVLLV
nr:putative zinc finger, CCHC-type [Tanacetum cinerariifolium]